MGTAASSVQAWSQPGSAGPKGPGAEAQHGVRAGGVPVVRGAGSSPPRSGFWIHPTLRTALGSPGCRNHWLGSRGCRWVGRAQGGWSREASRVASFRFPSRRLVQCPSLLLRGCLDVVVQLSGHLPSAPNPSQPQCGWDPWRQMDRGISPQAHPPSGLSQGWARPVPRGRSRARAAWALGSGGGGSAGGWSGMDEVRTCLRASTVTAPWSGQVHGVSGPMSVKGVQVVVNRLRPVGGCRSGVQPRSPSGLSFPGLVPGSLPPCGAVHRSPGPPRSSGGPTWAPAPLFSLTDIRSIPFK